MRVTTHRNTTYGASRTAPLLRVNEVAEVLAISRRSVYLLVGSGDLPAFRVGTRLRFRPEDVAAYLSAHKVAVT